MERVGLHSDQRKYDTTYLQQLLEEGYEVRPFVHTIEGYKTFVHLLRVLFEFRIVGIGG